MNEWMNGWMNDFFKPAVRQCFSVFWKVHYLKWSTEDPAATCFYRLHRNLSDVYKILGGVNYREELG